MKERQRWKAEEDALLRAYVKRYGAREWHLVSLRMNAPLDRDGKSCLERWKNYLRPGIKKGSLTEEEQRLVIRLQAKHGNKWKKIAAEVPGRTAKRLGKWWEVFKEKQQREQKEKSHKPPLDPIEEGRYEQILETFAEKLVKESPAPAPFLMATSNGGPAAPPPPNLLPPWLSNPNATSTARPPPPPPSVTLSLSPSAVASSPPIPWLQPDRRPSLPMAASSVEGLLVPELAECCREVEDGHRAWAAHRKEAGWRLRRVELQMESEKACRKKEKMEEMELKMKAVREEQTASLERIEAEYREQLAGLRRDAEAKEQKLAEQWAAKQMRLSKFLEQAGCWPRQNAELNGR